jgi:hypothetical protein
MIECHATHWREIVKTADYETDAQRRYWIAFESERIQVPSDKVLECTDNPTGRGSD